jgi:TIR domain-containing protein
MDSADDIAAVPSPRYWAFISYSQRDAQWAQWLHGAIERYSVPRVLVGQRVGSEPIPNRLFPVFRDREELATAADLGREIRQALRVSRSLIVICSPNAAASRWVNEEIRTFKATGRTDRIFSLIVAGEPYAATLEKGELAECLPPALRFHAEPDGLFTDQRAEPLAADIRQGKDSRRNALLKLIAGILNVRFDELRRREDERARRRRWRRVAESIVGLAAVLLLYAGLADADLAVPAGEWLRQRIDECACSVLRRIPSHEEVLQAASASRALLRNRIVAAVMQGKIRRGAKGSTWEIAQVTAAIYQDRDTPPPALTLATDLIGSVFSDDVLLTENGRYVGWKDVDFTPRAESAVWMLMAISSALARPDAADAAGRKVLLRRLSITQEIAERFYSPSDGGWNTYVDYAPEHRSAYPTALALHALLKVRAAGQCWRGDCASLDRMIRDASGWLIRAFVDENGVSGWRRFPDDVLAPVGDLDILVFAALARAHRDLGIPLPENLRAAAQRTLVALRQRAYLPPQQEISDEAYFINTRGERQRLILVTRMMWYPWSIDALAIWLSPAESGNLTPIVERALRRSLGHVVVSLSRDLAADMMNAPDWIQAETAYGLDQIR